MRRSTRAGCGTLATAAPRLSRTLGTPRKLTVLGVEGAGGCKRRRPLRAGHAPPRARLGPEGAHHARTERQRNELTGCCQGTRSACDLRQRADLLRVRPGRPCTGSRSGCRECRTGRASTGLASMSSLATVSRSWYSFATSSSTGANILHGPHHSAQKSTSTGLPDLRTSLSKRRVGDVLDRSLAQVGFLVRLDRVGATAATARVEPLARYGADRGRSASDVRLPATVAEALPPAQAPCDARGAWQAKVWGRFC